VVGGCAWSASSTSSGTRVCAVVDGVGGLRDFVARARLRATVGVHGVEVALDVGRAREPDGAVRRDGALRIVRVAAVEHMPHVVG
jgi:hypothetical protein